MIFMLQHFGLDGDYVYEDAYNIDDRIRYNDEKLEIFLRKMIYVVVIVSIFTSVYLDDLRYILLSMISIGSYFFSYKYKDIKFLYLAFISLSMIGFILIIPNIKEVIIIELFFMPLFFSISKVFESVSPLSKIKTYVLFRVAYYLVLYSSVVLNILIVGSGNDIVNFLVLSIEIFVINLVSFILLSKGINEVSIMNTSYIYLSKDKIILYSLLYTFIILFLILFVFIRL